MKITIEPLEFPLCVKEKLMKIQKISKLHIEFVMERIFILIKLTFQSMSHTKLLLVMIHLV